jgi:hypothetical protein
MYSTSIMTGKLNFNEKLHKYLQSLASKSGQSHFISDPKLKVLPSAAVVQWN